MIAFVAMLAEVSGWLWALVACAASSGLVYYLTRRPRQEVSTLPAVWIALDREQMIGPENEENGWDVALAEIERLREIARHARRLQLEAHVIEGEFRLRGEVLGALQDGILVLDRSERILYANQKARQVLTFPTQKNPMLAQVEGTPEILEGIRSVLGADLARKVKSCKVKWTDADGEERTYVIRCLIPDTDPADMPPGMLNAYIVALEDLTAEEKAARAKSEFIYGVSHELKTPLTSIQASLEMLVDGDLTDEARDKLISLSHGESVRLTQMVRELLDLARVEAGITEFRRETVAMEDMFQALHELHLPLVDRKSIQLTWNVSDYIPALVGDYRLLRQAFINIIGNAVKYTKDGGEVVVTAGPEGEELVVRIRDTGIGIAAEEVPHVFDKFFRAESAKQSRVQGTGLGLPMARYIIERHHGHIEVTSEIGVGTEFIVFLPVGSADPEGVESELMAVDGAM